jgi:thiol-disulfide isomerase/thioredoxin
MSDGDRSRRTTKNVALLAVVALGPFVLGPYISRAFRVDSPAFWQEHARPIPVRDVVFKDAEGRGHTLAQFRGRTVLLNIWATWCAPCRREMPTLNRLQFALGGNDFQVVAISVDRAGIAAVRRFYANHDVSHLASYIDDSGEAMHDLGAVGLPTTLLINADGLEVGRVIGAGDYDTPIWHARIQELIRTHALAE